MITPSRLAVWQAGAAISLRFGEPLASRCGLVFVLAPANTVTCHDSQIPAPTAGQAVPQFFAPPRRRWSIRGGAPASTQQRRRAPVPHQERARAVRTRGEGERTRAGLKPGGGATLHRHRISAARPNRTSILTSIKAPAVE